MIYTRLVKDGRKVKSMLKTITPLFDESREDLKAGEFWVGGTFFTHPARAKAVLVNLVPGRPGLAHPVDLGRRAMGVLESRKGLVMDWCGGVTRDGKRVVLVIKTLASDSGTGRNREVVLGREDLLLLAGMVPGRGRGRVLGLAGKRAALGR